MEGLDNKVIQSREIKKLVDFLIRESNYKHTEFRIVVREGGDCYGHVMDRDSSTVDFKLPDYRT